MKVVLARCLLVVAAVVVGAISGFADNGSLDPVGDYLRNKGVHVRKVSDGALFYNIKCTSKVCREGVVPFHQLFNAHFTIKGTSLSEADLKGGGEAMLLVYDNKRGVVIDNFLHQWGQIAAKQPLKLIPSGGLMVSFNDLFTSYTTPSYGDRLSNRSIPDNLELLFVFEHGWRSGVFSWKRVKPLVDDRPAITVVDSFTVTIKETAPPTIVWEFAMSQWEILRGMQISWYVTDSYRGGVIANGTFVADSKSPLLRISDRFAKWDIFACRPRTLVVSIDRNQIPDGTVYLTPIVISRNFGFCPN